MTYGVTPQGFGRKPLPAILSEIEQRNRDRFGQDVIQTGESPLGQLNGVVADITADLWQLAEAVYQSYDPDQAEGVRLDQLAAIRILTRATGEQDPTLRRDITNVGRARFDTADFYRDLLDTRGVSYASIQINDTATNSPAGIPPQHHAICVIGGDDADIADVVRRFVVPGIGTYGNTVVQTDLGGLCRSMQVIRPVERRVYAHFNVLRGHPRTGCPPASAESIAQTIANGLSGANRPRNGDDITLHMARAALAQVAPEIEIVSATIGFAPGGMIDFPLPIGLFEIASIAATDVTVEIL